MNILNEALLQDDFMPYDVVDFSTIDERFGTMEQFREMIDAIHNHDMHFVMDLPISTTSAKHIWLGSYIITYQNRYRSLKF